MIENLKGKLPLGPKLHRGFTVYSYGNNLPGADWAQLGARLACGSAEMIVTTAEGSDTI